MELRDENQHDEKDIEQPAADIGNLNFQNSAEHAVIARHEKFCRKRPIALKEAEEWIELIHSVADLQQRNELLEQCAKRMIDIGAPTLAFIGIIHERCELIDNGIAYDSGLYSAIPRISNAIAFDYKDSNEVWKELEVLEIKVKGAASLSSFCEERLKFPHMGIEETYAKYLSIMDQELAEATTTGRDLKPLQKRMNSVKSWYNKNKSISAKLETFELTYNNYGDKSDFWLKYLELVCKIHSKNPLLYVIAVFQRCLNNNNATLDVWEYFISELNDISNGSDRGWTLYFTEVYPANLIAISYYIKSLALSAESVDIVERLKTRVSGLEHYAYKEWTEYALAVLAFEHSVVSQLNGDQRDSQLLKFRSDLKQFFEHALVNNNPSSTDGQYDIFHKVERSVAIYWKLLSTELNDDQLQKDSKVEARRAYEQITKKFPDEVENWLIASNYEISQSEFGNSMKILNGAISRAGSLDWPERVFEEALTVAQCYGGDLAFMKVRAKVLRKRRELAEQRLMQQEDHIARQEVIEIEQKEQDQVPAEHPVKREAEDDMDRGAEHEEEDQEMQDVSKKIKPNNRDREHLRIIVKNLPSSISKNYLARFFKDCGEINEVVISSIEDKFQATVEFKDEFSILRALTKDHKKISGREISVTRANNLTLWVTNFPPSFKEQDLRTLFETIGAITSLRLPSLKFNSQRRFCYVDYANSEIARIAETELNGKEIDGFKIVAKISNPKIKQNRTGAVEEGREIFVSKIDFFKVDKQKLFNLFKKYGEIENIHLPLSAENKSMDKLNDGYGFITFKTAEAANSSLELNHSEFEGRNIEVNLAIKKSQREKLAASGIISNYKNLDSAIAIRNLSDKINAYQIESIFKEIGEIKKVVLVPEHNGAIIDFKDEKSVGLANLKLNGVTIDDLTINICTVSELLDPSASKASTTTFIPPTVRRRRGNVHSSPAPSLQPAHAATETKPTSVSTPKATPKSNADFRSMFLQNK